MGVDEISVMDGSKCILQVRGVRPFLSEKYDIEKHHNYRYLADSNEKYNFNILKFLRAEKKSGKNLLRGVDLQVDTFTFGDEEQTETPATQDEGQDVSQETDMLPNIAEENEDEEIDEADDDDLLVHF